MTRRVRFFPVLGNRWSLWGEEGGVEPEELGLDPSIRPDLSGYYDFWGAHHHWEKGWDAPENARVSWETGSDLVARIRRELGDDFTVEDRRDPPSATSS